MTPEEKKKLAWNAALAGISLIPGGVAFSSAAKAAQVGAKSLPWLVRAGRGLTTGKGWNLPFRKVNRATGTPGTPGTVGVMGPGTRPVQGIGNLRTPAQSAPRTIQDIRNVGTRTVGREGVPGIPAGLLRRKPIRSAGAVGAAAFGGYPLVNQLVGGEDPAVQGVGGAYAPEDPWAAPSDMLGFAEQQEAMAAQGKQQLSQMLKYGFMIAAAGGKPDKFFDRGMKIMEQSQAYNNSKHFADVVRAVYKEGDMPKNAREAYERLVPLLGPEEAQVLSGHQLGMERGKTKDERIWSEIMTLAQSDIEGAAAMLVNAWGTGRLKSPPVQQNQKMRMEIARNMIQAELGVPQLAEGVQSLEVTSA
jgi:hypothetical protein